MLIEGLLNLLSWLLDLLLTPINIPSLPENVSTIMQTGFDYITDGLALFAAFTHFSYILSLFAICIVIQAAFLVYKFVLWLLRKIPMAGVE